MRAWLIGAYLANLALAGVLAVREPLRVVAQAAANGRPDAGRWGALPLALLAVLCTLLLALILLAPRLVRRFPAHWLSVPNAAYWQQEANRPEAERRIRRRLHLFGLATFLMLLLAGLVVLHVKREPPPQSGDWQRLSLPVRGVPAPLPEPAHSPWEPWALHGLGVAFLAYSAFWYFGFLRDFRVPEGGK